MAAFQERGKVAVTFIDNGKRTGDRLVSPLWELRLDGPTGRTKLANHRQWKPLMIALGT